MARFNVKVTGIKRTIRSKLTDRNLAQDVDQITEAYARKIANDAAEKAPILTGLLKNSLPNGVERSAIGEWQIVAMTDYTLVQEYTHQTKKGFVRKAVWDNKEGYRKAVEQRAKRR
ncbi:MULTISPECIES: hypothetical protein [Virgibacillus]|uniref:hypothetical protein n=1 Tax=Virgibacillus TaxID=84406 RepID=UPI000986849C|nr:MULTISPECIES: hypothetical protein [Virgibacillus]MBU5266296.1 hypothetical protein [Virgibacillus proomii]